MHHPMDAAILEDVMTQVLSLDFTFMGTSTVRAQANHYHVMYDNDIGATKVYRTRKKGVVRWVIAAIVMDIASLGCGNCKICIRHDRENSMLAIRDAITRNAWLLRFHLMYLFVKAGLTVTWSVRPGRGRTVSGR